ncbi:TIGR00341 family protein [Mucilaginibacter sp. RS28]|uniref:TIGR00341 family protein n=1 Tax=Mucilaginibacter straminoryzae TaxID=2932774 RepID=A0A9X1X2L1_9SPHI|nr:TIGR00341 family protein [Mucilaginibacter straminoryzae]MCJ8208840.1 TIGR00341 family protein [Mucilaginibacter straminoryzae]
MINPFTRILGFLDHRFNLHEDRAEEPVIVESIRKNVDFKGVNLWALIFAIFIASIGLNVNSTAVIIGAMLISPIMGPVMGIGLGIGINDLDLVKKGGRNLLIATIISVITSTIYFSISPLHEAQSELLARTSPSIWDVFIAFFGGLAGMVAASRKEKTNVVPGVAIATALMPPLCTAGFGIATGHWYYFIGALYLYFINSVFIAIATYLMTRYLKLHHKQFEEPGIERKVTRYMIAIVIITIIPSIVMAYRIVDKSIFEANANKFIEEQFQHLKTQVVSKSFKYSRKEKSIEVLLLGEHLDKSKQDSIRKNLADYKLSDVKLHIRQGLDAKQQLDLSQIKASILEDVFSSRKHTDTVIQTKSKAVNPNPNVFKEMRVLYPTLQSLSINHAVIYSGGDSILKDTVPVAVTSFKTRIRKADQVKLQTWLRTRLRNDSLKLVVTTSF